MGTRRPPQAPPRRLTALRRRHAVGIGAISAAMRGSWCVTEPSEVHSHLGDLRVMQLDMGARSCRIECVGCVNIIHAEPGVLAHASESAAVFRRRSSTYHCHSQWS